MAFEYIVKQFSKPTIRIRIQVQNRRVETNEKRKFRRGDLVWGKMRGFTWWPAFILSPSDCNKPNSDRNKVWLFWFGEHNMSQVDKNCIGDFAFFYAIYSKKSTRRPFLKAVYEALKVIAAMNNLSENNPEWLDSWGMDGFVCSVDLKKRWTGPGLPDIIDSALTKRTEGPDENGIEDDVIAEIQKGKKSMSDDVIAEIQKGKKSMNDICIACCKENAKLVEPHPLFVGQLCKKCRKDVKKACALPPSIMHDICVICGQGGSLVYCNKEICCRGYCKQCVEYLHSEKEYEKIELKDYWECYLCSNEIGTCLIEPRDAHEASMAATVESFFNDVSLNDIDVIISKVLNKEKSLEEICIACCKENNPLIKPHPLFFGKICEACVKDIDRICNLPSGKIQRYCIVCGQGGTLVFCDKRMCKRAYCEECINALDSKKAFKRISKKKIWMCYLCKPSRNNSCLIRRRIPVSDSSESNHEISDQVLTDVSSANASTPLQKLVPKKGTKRTKTTPYKPAKRITIFEEIASVVEDVRNGKMSLEDICIGCCNITAQLVTKHPLFIGGICKSCKKDVSRICSLPCKKMQKFCIVCGQGGEIVFCSSELCLRAYCQPCIEYFDSEQSYVEIVNCQVWLCYFCEKSQNNSCLIKKRMFNDAVSDSFMSNEELVDSSLINETTAESPLALTATTINSTANALSSIETGEGALVREILKGNKSIEDICFACCKEKVNICAYHPFFIGKICTVCLKDVAKVCTLPRGIFHKFCIICGQGGCLVYCSKTSCSRAFCKICIEYFDSRNSFRKIVENDGWLCYLCAPDENAKCFIRKRKESDVLSYIISIAPNYVPPIDAPVFPKAAASLKDVLRGKKTIQAASLEDVLRGEKTIQDICIACCKKRVILIARHPLFVAKVCKSCKNDVMKACDLPCGKMQDHCVICGQGGNLVYCSRKKCSRAYCQFCIEYLDSEESFAEIVDDDDWKCYYCKQSKNGKCLIKRREREAFLFNYLPPLHYKEKAPKTKNKEDVISKLWKGKISLDDTCIACCKEDVELYDSHPLFLGKICIDCEIDVNRACKLPVEEYHRNCVVCGQGGALLYCCNSVCSRAYCKLCIDYLDSKNTYDKIVNNNNWFCYMCNINPSDKCFIKRKQDTKVVPLPLPPIPELKTPIVVLAFNNEMGLHALKKSKIKVNTYQIAKSPYEFFLICCH